MGSTYIRRKQNDRASGIFVPSLTAAEEIKEIMKKVNAPLNVLALPRLTNCNKLKEVEVKHYSFGKALSDKVIAFLEKNATQLLELGDTTQLYEELV